MSKTWKAPRRYYKTPQKEIDKLRMQEARGAIQEVLKERQYDKK